MAWAADLNNIQRHLALLLPELEAGGAQRVMLSMAGGLARRGHRVDLLVLAATGPLRDDEGNPVEPLDTADDPEALVQVEMARAMAQATVGTVLAEETEIEVDGQTIQIEPSTKPRPAPSTPAVNTGLNAAKQAVVVTRNEYLAALADYVTALEAELGIQS